MCVIAGWGVHWVMTLDRKSPFLPAISLLHLLMNNLLSIIWAMALLMSQRALLYWDFVSDHLAKKTPKKIHLRINSFYKYIKNWWTELSLCHTKHASKTVHRFASFIRVWFQNWSSVDKQHNKQLWSRITGRGRHRLHPEFTVKGVQVFKKNNDLLTWISKILS